MRARRPRGSPRTRLVRRLLPVASPARIAGVLMSTSWTLKRAETLAGLAPVARIRPARRSGRNAASQPPEPAGIVKRVVGQGITCCQARRACSGERRRPCSPTSAVGIGERGPAQKARPVGKRPAATGQTPILRWQCNAPYRGRHWARAATRQPHFLATESCPVLADVAAVMWHAHPRSSAGASMRCGGPPVHICKRATAVAVHGPDRPSRVHPRATTVRRSEPGSQIPGNHRLDRIECGRVMPVRRCGVEQRPQFLPACEFEPLQQVAADPLHVVGLDWRQRACPGQGRGLRGYAAGAGEVQGPASFRTARPYRHPANPASPACAAVAPRSCAVHAGAGRSAAGPW